LTGRLTSYLDPARGIAGARVTLDPCPGATAVSDADGRLRGEVSRDVPYDPRVEARSFLTMRSGEQVALGPIDLESFLFPSALSTLLPHWSADAPTVLAIVIGPNAADVDAGGAPDAGTPGPCTSHRGATFTVVGHPEAVVTYFAGSTTPTADPTLTSTDTIGAAEISGLAATAPGEPITLAVSSPSCPALSFVSYPHTGRYVLENGVLTLAAAFLEPLPEP
jgi:hypothetical protein